MFCWTRAGCYLAHEHEFLLCASSPHLSGILFFCRDLAHALDSACNAKQATPRAGILQRQVQDKEPVPPSSRPAAQSSTAFLAEAATHATLVAIFHHEQSGQ